MQHSSFRDKGETVDLFAQTSNADSFKLLQIDEDDVITDITPSSQTINTISTNLKKTTVTLPNVNSTVVALLNKEPIFMRVGSPKIRFTFYAGENALGLTIPYEMIDQDDGSIIESGNLIEFTDGFYGFNPATTGDAIIKVKNLVFPLRVPYVTDSAGMSGSIYLQKNAWMMLACPIGTSAKIYEDFISVLENQTGLAAADMFEVFNAYPYIDGQNREFLSFVPGVTNPASKSNFNLIYEDTNGEKEITGFWVKTKDYDGDVITFNWIADV